MLKTFQFPNIFFIYKISDNINFKNCSQKLFFKNNYLIEPNTFL